MAGVIYFQVDVGPTDCSMCPLVGAGDCCSILRSFGVDNSDYQFCDAYDLSSIRRCEDGEVVRVG